MYQVYCLRYLPPAPWTKMIIRIVNLDPPTMVNHTNPTNPIHPKHSKQIKRACPIKPDATPGTRAVAAITRMCVAIAQHINTFKRYVHTHAFARTHATHAHEEV